MQVGLRVTSNGRVTIPKPVRDALGLAEGDQVVLHVYRLRAGKAGAAELLELAGSVRVPAAKHGVSWDEIRRVARAKRAR